jgi:hypothetical protein
MPGGEPPNKRMRGDGDASSSGDAYTQVADDMCGKGKVLIFSRDQLVSMASL